MNNEQLLILAIDCAKKAGVEALKYYQSGDYTAEIKDDNSPVTSADIAANDVLMQQLALLTPDIPIISEEVGAVELKDRIAWQRYWLLDPIDGTGEFILASGDFAVNIALVENGWPSIGVIHAPDKQITYYGQSGVGAFKEDKNGTTKIHVAPYIPGQVIKVAVSRRQKLELMGQYLSNKFEFEFVSLGSCSLKNGLIAEGGADCYLRIGPTGEWDTGASHCILEEAGGAIISSEFKSLSYNKRESLLNPDFISTGSADIPWQQVIKAHKAER
jgi:3'(2'), 5'-bisphosphate nucleotidase